MSKTTIEHQEAINPSTRNRLAICRNISTSARRPPFASPFQLRDQLRLLAAIAGSSSNSAIKYRWKIKQRKPPPQRFSLGDGFLRRRLAAWGPRLPENQLNLNLLSLTHLGIFGFAGRSYEASRPLTDTGSGQPYARKQTLPAARNMSGLGQRHHAQFGALSVGDLFHSHVMKRLHGPGGSEPWPLGACPKRWC